MKVKPDTEAAFTRRVIALATLRGFKVAHFRPGRTTRGWRTPCQGDAKGFPDLVMIGPLDAVQWRRRLVVAELKMPGRHTTPEQTEWLEAWRLVPAAEVYTWYPYDWQAIERILIR